MDEFIKKFAEALDLDDFSELCSDTEFKLLDEWSSMSAVAVIAMADTDYDSDIKGKDIREADTLGDLYEIIKNNS